MKRDTTFMPSDASCIIDVDGSGTKYTYKPWIGRERLNYRSF